MTIHIQLDNANRHRVISDDTNPRLYAEEWKCVGCNVWTDGEDIVWAMADGTLSTITGMPWCVHCVPPDNSDGETP